jgi:ParB family chromosome partitioning protein
MSDIAIKNIFTAKQNPRSAYDEEKLKELVESIRERGILQPLVCREKDGQYELIAGHRRFEAAKILGLETVPVIIRDTLDGDIQFDQVIENLQREDLSSEDKFQAFKKMRDQGLKISEISKKTGVNTTVISTILGLEELDTDIRLRTDIEEYPKQLIAKAPRSIQNILADRIAKGELVVRCLLADILPTIKKLISEELFTDDEKQQIIERIARETIFHEYPAKSILNQELGKKKLEKAGILPKIVSNSTLEEYVNACKSFSNTLFEIQATHLQYLDKSLVLRLFAQLKDICDHINTLIPTTGGKDGKKNT